MLLLNKTSSASRGQNICHHRSVKYNAKLISLCPDKLQLTNENTAVIYVNEAKKIPYLFLFWELTAQDLL